MQERLRLLTDTVRQLPVNTRILAGLLVVAVIASAVYLAVQPTSDTPEELFGGRELTAGELDRMEAAFSTAGLANWERGERNIRVPSQQKFSFVAALAEQDALPEHSDEIFFDTMKSSAFYESSQQRAMRMKYATQREAGMIVQAMTGIESATVRYVDVEGKGFGSPKTIRANVAVRATNDRPLLPDQVTAICDTVAFTIGAEAKDVVVTDLVTVRAYRGGEVVRRNPQSDQLAAQQQVLEARYHNAIRAVLSMIDDVVINVQVQLATPAIDADDVAMTPSPARAPIAASKPPAPTLFDIATNRTRVSDSSYGNMPLSIHSLPESKSRDPALQKLSSPLATATLAHVTGTVSIPKSHFRRVWRETHAAHAARAGSDESDLQPDEATLLSIETETIANVRQLVKSCLPTPIDAADAEKQVVITSHYDVQAPIATAETPADWLPIARSYWREIAIGTAVLLIVVCSSWYRTTRAKEPHATSRSTSMPIVPQRETTTETPYVAPPSSSLHEELAQRVQQDPTEAAVALNAWLRDAA